MWFRTRENVKPGDLVLELDPKHKRCQWKMATIINTYLGKDGCKKGSNKERKRRIRSTNA